MLQFISFMVMVACGHNMFVWGDVMRFLDGVGVRGVVGNANYNRRTLGRQRRGWNMHTEVRTRISPVTPITR